MSSQQPGTGNNQSQQAAGGDAQPGDAAASVGHATSGEAGASRKHETMAETGGSGGAGLTGNQSGAATGQPVPPPDEVGVVIDSGARGAQDTRSRQAGGSKTGLGSPETGANQSPADIEHKK
jgi:hypothetical protein